MAATGKSLAGLAMALAVLGSASFVGGRYRRRAASGRVAGLPSHRDRLGSSLSAMIAAADTVRSEASRASLRITGTDRAYGFDIVDEKTGASVLARLAAQQLRVVLDNSGARLEIDCDLALDHTVPGAVQAFMADPVTGQRREVRAVEFLDGGRATYPRDFSSRGDAKQFGEALPQRAATLSKEI